MVKIGHKVREILLVRHARKHMGGRKPIPLSSAAMAVACQGSFPSQTWFTRFFAVHNGKLEPKVPQKADSKRAAAV